MKITEREVPPPNYAAANGKVRDHLVPGEVFVESALEI